MEEIEYYHEEKNNDFTAFSNSVKKLNGKRTHKIRNSYGIYAGYKYYNKIRPKEPEYKLTESQYFAITRKINNMLAKSLSNGNDIILPCRFGRLEIRKHESYINIKDGKITTNLPVDWDKTLKYWYEDKEAFDKKVLIRNTDKVIYRVYYNKHNANYNNKSFYQFNVNRNIKTTLKNNIKENKIDAFLL